MTVATNELSLTVSRLIQADPETLYKAWLDPTMLMKFMMPGPGMTCPRVTTDPRIGGKYEIVMATPEQEIPHTGEYLELVPYSKMVFTWNSPFADYGTEVRLTFSPEADGTRIELTHIKFREAEARDNHESGWSAILDTLSAHVA